MADRKIYTFTEIVNAAITKIGALSSTITDFSPGSNVRSIIESIAHFVEFTQLQINNGIDSFSIRKAKGADIDTRIQDYGISRKEGVASYGDIVFSRNTPSPSAFTIYAGTQVSTQPDVFGNTIDYTLDNDVTFPSGAISVTGQVTCSVVGVIGNVPSGYVTNMTSSIPGVDSVTNPAAFTSGGDRETDEQLRERLPLYINGLKSGNESAIRAAALSVPGITVARMVENEPSLGHVTVYATNQSGVLSLQQMEEVRTAIDKAAAFGIVTNLVTPSLAYITVSLDVSYDSKYYTKNIVEENIRTEIYNFVLNNTDLTLKTIDIGIVAYKVPGVRNIKNVTINGSTDDYNSTEFDVVRLLDKYTSITINYV